MEFPYLQWFSIFFYFQDYTWPSDEEADDDLLVRRRIFIWVANQSSRRGGGKEGRKVAQMCIQPAASR